MCPSGELILLEFERLLPYIHSHNFHLLSCVCDYKTYIFFYLPYIFRLLVNRLISSNVSRSRLL